MTVLLQVHHIFWGLRDYGVKGQLGLEPDFRDYLKIMQKIMIQLKRVLKPTGSCWINLGDTYAGGQAHSDWLGVDKKFDCKRMRDGKFKGIKKNTLQVKSRYGIPERFYINCIDDGWIARNHIPWVKANSMPSSVKDRFTNKWESIFFFVKNQKYYFNLDAVREKKITESKPFNFRVRETKRGHAQAKLSGGMSDKEDQEYDFNGERKGRKKDNNEKLNNINFIPLKQDNVLGADGKPKANYKGFNVRYKKTLQEKFEKGKWRQHYDENGNCLGCGKHWTKHTVSERAKGSMHEASKRTEDIVWCNPSGKNPGDVFFINPKPFGLICMDCPITRSKIKTVKNNVGDVIDQYCQTCGKRNLSSHFASYPPELPLQILKCACPKMVLYSIVFLELELLVSLQNNLGYNGLESN